MINASEKLGESVVTCTFNEFNDTEEREATDDLHTIQTLRWCLEYYKNNGTLFNDENENAHSGLGLLERYVEAQRYYKKTRTNILRLACDTGRTYINKALGHSSGHHSSAVVHQSHSSVVGRTDHRRAKRGRHRMNACLRVFLLNQFQHTFQKITLVQTRDFQLQLHLCQVPSELQTMEKLPKTVQCERRCALHHTQLLYIDLRNHRDAERCFR